MSRIRRVVIVMMLAWGIGIVSVATTHAATGPTINHCLFSWTDTDTGLASFTVKIGTTPGGPYPLVFPIPPTVFSTVNLCTGIPDGQHYAVVTATNTVGTESPPSVEAPFFLNAAIPAAPGGFGVR